MAGGDLIGALRVTLGLDSAQFVNGAKKAQSTLGGLSGAIKGFAAAAGASLTLAGLVTVLKSTTDHIDELGKVSQKIGIPVEELSKLEYAAGLSELSLEELSLGAGRLSKSLAEIAGGGTNDASRALQAMGINVLGVNGQLRPTSEIIADVADKFSRMEDGANKIAISLALFSRAGKDWIPFLNQGKEGLLAATAEAEHFGLVVSQEASVAADQFNDNIDRLKASGQGFVNLLVMEFLPQMTELSNSFLEWVKSGDGARAFISGLKTELEDFVRILEFAGKVFETIAIRWNAFQTTPGLLTSAPEEWAKHWEDASKKVEGVWDTSIKATQADVDSLLNSIETFKLPTAKLPAPIVESTESIAARRKLLSEEAAARNKVMSEGAAVFDKTRNAVENYQIEIRKLNDLWRAGAINSDTYQRAVVQLQDEFKSTSDAAKTLGDDMNAAFGEAVQGWLDQAIDGTFNLSTAFTDLSKQLTKMALNAAFQQMFGGGSVSPSQAGGGFNFGSLFGFAKGGAFTVPGSGGIDNKVVAFRASPGERVNVARKGQDERGSGVIINNHGTRMSQQEDNNGNTVLDFENMLARSILERNSPVSRALDKRNSKLSPKLR